MPSITDTAAQSAREAWASIGRQFDDEEGGGFADELGAVYDPYRQASEETEEDVRTLADLGAFGGIYPSLLSLSDALDRQSGIEVPGDDTDDDDGGSDDMAGDGSALRDAWEGLFAGNTPTEGVQQEAGEFTAYVQEQAFDSPYITLAVIFGVLLVVLYLVRPLLTIGANVSG